MSIYEGKKREEKTKSDWKMEVKRMSNGQATKREFDLEGRLIDFAVKVIRLAECLPRTRAGAHIAGQLIRSGTSSPPNYGEAQSAESRADFIHKMRVCLKELRETRVWLLMISRLGLVGATSEIDTLIDEDNELISIFVSSVRTAKRKSDKHA